MSRLRRQIPALLLCLWLATSADSVLGQRGGGFPGGGGGPPGSGYGRGGASFGGGASDFIRRLDSNGNGMLDPEESQGRAKMFLDRFVSAIPGIDLSKPVPIEKLSQGFARLREQRARESGSNSSGGSSSGRSSSGRSSSGRSAIAEPLVPGFGTGESLDLPPGFGDEGELFTVKVINKDHDEAEERFRRYDSNRDGFLDRAEIARGRWSDDPFTFDRNHDGRLSPSELAVRYAQRRVASEATATKASGTASGPSTSSPGGETDSRLTDLKSRFGRGGGDGSGGGRSGFFGRRESSDAPSSEETATTIKSDRLSYRFKTAVERLPEGLPPWFSQNDGNADGQVAMSEFAVSWTDRTLADFGQFDLNLDGIVTAAECLRATDKGAVRGTVASTSPYAASRSRSPSTSGIATTSSTTTTATSGGSSIDQRTLDFSKKTLGKYDTNGDGSLEKEEWSKMSSNPETADTDGDGKVSVEELAIFYTKQ